MKPLIIDANNLAMRTIFATWREDLKAGQTFTGGVFGSLRSFAYMLESAGYGPVVAVYDDVHPPARLKLLPGYKADRASSRDQIPADMHDRVFGQKEIIEGMWSVLGVPVLRVSGLEADDVIIALVRRWADAGVEAAVWSNDADLLQAVNLGGVVVGSKHGHVSAFNFKEVTGVPYQFYVLFRALTGDSSDCIPGVRGCGEKRAAQLIADVVDAPRMRGVDSAINQYRFLLDCLATARREQVKLPRWLDGFEDHRERMINTIRGIDLRNSYTAFGGTPELLDSVIDGSIVPKFDEDVFVAFCSRLRFRTVLDDIVRYRSLLLGCRV